MMDRYWARNDLSEQAIAGGRCPVAAGPLVHDR